MCENKSKNTVPLRGRRVEFRNSEKRGLVISSSDCDEKFPPSHVNQKHRELQKRLTGEK